MTAYVVRGIGLTEVEPKYGVHTTVESVSVMRFALVGFVNATSARHIAMVDLRKVILTRMRRKQCSR